MQVRIPVAYNVCEVKLDKINEVETCRPRKTKQLKLIGCV